MTQLSRFKIIFTSFRTGKPGFVTVRAQDRQHALNIAAVLGLEDAVVLFKMAAISTQKEAPK